MSLLSRDELRVVVSRDQIQMVRMTSDLTPTGWAFSLVDKKNITFESDPEAPWSNAMNQLDVAIATVEKKPETTSVVVANHFFRYAIVKGDSSLKSEVEQVAFVKHRFGQLYGESANTWEVRLDQEYPGAPFIASALERGLLENIREIFASAKIKLNSVQPSLMKAYNMAQVVTDDKSAWFVLYEQGNLAIAWLENGRIKTLRSVKVGEDWLEKLTEIIERETFLSELDASTKEIYLMSFEEKQKTLPKNPEWKIYKINPEIPSGLSKHFEDRFALAMCD